MTRSLRILAAIAWLAACRSNDTSRLPDDEADGDDWNRPSWIGRDLYTQTNLHPDVARRRLYSINYQLAGLIPICTRVRVTDFDDGYISFVANGIEFDYLFRPEYMTEGLDGHLARYFGETCDRGETLGTKDRDGIAAGRVQAGMTKAGVLKAMGYPPPHATPDLASPQWRYWRNRFDTLVVHFDGEVVTSIED